MAFLDDLDLKLDPWEVEYGSELPLSGGEPVAEGIDLGVERPVSEWAPIVPTDAADRPRRIVFVDGVRRVEARVVARRGGRVIHGAFGSFGVGAAACEGGVAKIESETLGRVLALDSGESLAEPVRIDAGLVYRVVSAPESDPAAPLQRLQDEMRLCEERFARSLADREDALVVTDGPLMFGDPVRGSAVGFVKRLFELYVDPSLLGILAALPAGARSPLFAIEAPSRFARYSWFLRLATPHAADSDLAGLVRLEVSAGIGKDAARRLADATALALPRFAPGRGRDPRSPQNLLPIGALESHLRRSLGDPRLIRRKIGARLAERVHA